MSALPTPPEAIRARIDSALRMVELAHAVQDAETTRYSIAVNLADMAARGDDLAVVTAQYQQAVDVLELAKDEHQRALHNLAGVRHLVPIVA